MPLALFDLDNTLIDRQRAVTEWAAGFCRERSLDQAAEQYLVDVLAPRAYPATFEQLRQELEIEASAADLWSGYVAAVAAMVTCSPETTAGLQRLRAAGWRLGILTNGSTDIQHAKIEAAGLVPCVDGITVSEEVGVRKPAPQAFHTAITRSGGTSTQRAWMVGDNPETGMAGAQQAGLDTIWISHRRTWPSHLSPPRHTETNVAAAISHLMDKGAG